MLAFGRAWATSSVTLGPSSLRSSGGFTIPAPKYVAHTRFTNTRAVSGLSFEAIRWAISAKEPLEVAGGGTKRAIVAVGRSILVIVWHLLSDPDARFHDLGPGFYDTRIDAERKKRNHIRQLEALGYKVTLQPAA